MESLYSLCVRIGIMNRLLWHVVPASAGAIAIRKSVSAPVNVAA